MNRLVLLILVLMFPLSTLGQLSQGESDLEKSVERRVEVTENKTIFTVFCLLNLGGYDEENNPDGMHPVRVRVREQLSSKVRPELARSIRDFYRQHSSADAYHEYEAVLEGDARVHLSRRYRKQVQEKLELRPAADEGG